MTSGAATASDSAPSWPASSASTRAADAEAAVLTPSIAKCVRHTSKGRSPRSRAAAVAVNPECTRKCTAAITASGPTTVSSDRRSLPGARPRAKTNAWAPSHTESAGLAALKRMRSALWPRRHDRMNPSAAIATVAGAGPNSMADVSRKVSLIDACTGTPGIRSERRPNAMASTEKSSHSAGRGMPSSVVTDWAMAKSPSAVTAAT